jgi:hypothetical protein
MMRSRRLLVGSVAAAVATLCMGVVGAGAAPTAHRLRHVHPLISLAAPRTAFHAVQSNNWSGYDKGVLDTSSTFTSISGQWTVPTATQHTAGQAESSATWVGIGGGCVDMTSGCLVTDPSLIQAGTEQDVGANGQATYSAWWELLPLPSVTASTPVHPGDTVSVSISGPLLWTITFKDLTDGQGFTESLPYPSTMDSAEWVEEAPVVVTTGGSSPVSAGEAALPNLTAANFDLATLNGKNPALTPAYEMQMVGSNGGVLATPSGPDGDGDGFDVCTYSSSCTAPAS